MFGDFRRNQSGATAILFALSMIPIIGGVGASVDYTSATQVRARLQQAADAGSLAGAKLASEDNAKIIQHAKSIYDSNTKEFGGMYPPKITIDKNKSTVTVKVSGEIKTNFLAAINIKSIPLSVYSTSQIAFESILKANIPKSSFLDTEAMDYNRVYVYCYDASRKNMSDKGRSNFVPLYDNVGTNYNYKAQECKENESISFQLYNVICTKDKPEMWNTNVVSKLFYDKSENTCADTGSRYDYFTDTTISGNIMKHNIAENLNVLETKLCSNLGSCKRLSQGGTLPEGKNRSPNIETAACEPGMYMYFGWEDQPNEYVKSDMDFDDISFVMECPKKEKSSKPTGVRIVK